MSKTEARKKRHLKVRKKIFGTPSRPRMCVFKSVNHVYVQIIDDTKGETLCSYSTLNLTKEEAGDSNKSNIKFATIVGKRVAELARQAGITTVVFDRNGYVYHGVIKALADAAREKGLEF